MVLGCSFLYWNRYIRKSATDFTVGALKSTWLVTHQFVKMVHFASKTDLVDPLWGASILAATASENPCSLIPEALGAKHGDFRFLWGIWLKGWIYRLGRTGRLSGIWLDMSLGPKTKVCWASPEQSEWFSFMGSPATSPPLCPRWVLVGRHMRPDPPMADWVHPQLWPGDLVPVTQIEVTCLSEAGATCCILFGRPLEGETTLFGWSGLVWIACLLPRSVCLECVRLWWLLTAWYTRSRFSTVGTKWARPHASFLVYVWHYCSVVGCYKHNLVWGLGTLLRLERLPSVPDSLYAACFLVVTRNLWQCARLSERPTLLLMRLERSAEHVLVGVMVDLGAHCSPPTTNVGGAAEIWVLEWPFLVILVLSNCFWDATVWVSYVADLGELAFLWLLADLSRTWIVGLDRSAGTVVSVFLLGGSATSPVWVGPDRTWGRTGNQKVENLLGLQFWFF